MDNLHSKNSAIASKPRPKIVIVFKIESSYKALYIFKKCGFLAKPTKIENAQKCSGLCTMTGSKIIYQLTNW